MAGTVAVIFQAESTVNTEPWTVTLVPIVPEVGLNELIVGGAAAGTAGTSPTPSQYACPA